MVTVLALLSAGAPVFATTYHVSVDGSDGNPGTAGEPWATLQHAAGVVVAGDTVIVHPGAYQGFDLRTSGSAHAWITFRAHPGVVIDQPNAVTPDGVNVENASHVVIEGFTVQGDGTCPGTLRNGLRAALGSQIVFRRNRSLDNCLRAFFSGFVDDFVVEDNEAAGSVAEHGIYASNSGDRPVIRRNLVHGNAAAGIHMNGDLSAGGDGIITDALVEDNVILDNGFAGGAGINCDGVQDSTIRNNMIVGNHATGIALFRQDGGGPSTGNLVINNTVVNSVGGRWGITISDGSTGNTVLNNIFISRHGFRGAMDVRTDSLPGLLSDFNAVEDRFTTDGGDSLILTLAQWQAATGQDGSSFVASEAELFVDPTLPDGDFHLAEASPAINAGTPSGAPPTDFEGDPRPFGAGVDIGADEWAHCAAGEELVLEDQTVTRDIVHEACRILAGPAFVVEAPARLTLRAGKTVVLRDGFAVRSGAALRVELDPQAGVD